VEYVGVHRVEGFDVELFKASGLLIGVPRSFGPRILYLAPEERRDFNIFAVLPEVSVETPDGVWRLYGGHRLWVAPEEFPRSYYPDNSPVELGYDSKRVVVRGEAEARNYVRKEVVIEEVGEGVLRIVHRVENVGRWSVEFSPWAITALRPGGFAFIPLKPLCRDSRCLQPDRLVAFWPYTKLNDPRIRFLERHLVVIHDPSMGSPMKVGTLSNAVAYHVEGLLFAKMIRVEADKQYPDLGCSVEVYAEARYIELETLAPLKKVKPGEAAEHVELWILTKARISELTDESLEAALSTVVSAKL